jgi:hypothetical protein
MVWSVSVTLEVRERKGMLYESIMGALYERKLRKSSF